MKQRCILKIQRPLVANVENPGCLITDSRKTICFIAPFDDYLQAQFAVQGHPPKLYVEADYYGGEVPHIKIIRAVTQERW